MKGQKKQERQLTEVTLAYIILARIWLCPFLATRKFDECTVRSLYPQVLHLWIQPITD